MSIDLYARGAADGIVPFFVLGAVGVLSVGWWMRRDFTFECDRVTRIRGWVIYGCAILGWFVLGPSWILLHQPTDGGLVLILLLAGLTAGILLGCVISRAMGSLLSEAISDQPDERVE